MYKILRNKNRWFTRNCKLKFGCVFSDPPGISKRMSNLSADETTFNKSNNLHNNVLTESGLKYEITFHQQKYISKVTNNAKKKKKKNRKTKNHIV